MNRTGNRPFFDLVLAGSIVFIGLTAGCTSMKYSRHLAPSIKETKVPASTIAVFPVSQLNYQPPTGCSGSGIAPGSQEKYQENWNKNIAATINLKFPKQKFVFLRENEGILSSNIVDFFGVIEQSRQASRAQRINTLNNDSTVYEPMTTSILMQNYLRPVVDSTGAQYALVFVTPSLAGSVQTNYNYSPNGGGMSQSTVYTADVQALVWECATGRLLFSSGGWGAGSSSCFLMIPQDMAINSANTMFENNLLLLLSRLMKYDASKRYASSM